MNEIKDILRYISPDTSFVVNLDDYRRFLEIAKIEERERIIKLLQDDFYHYLESSTQTISKGQQLGETVWVHAGNCEGCHLITLIKGEQK